MIRRGRHSTSGAGGIEVSAAPGPSPDGMRGTGTPRAEETARPAPDAATAERAARRQDGLGARLREEAATETRHRRPGLHHRRLRRLLAVCLLWAALTPGAAQSQTADALPLTLKGSIALALKNSRSAIAARLKRDEEKLALEAAEERYRPRADFGASVSAARDRERMTNLTLGSSLRVPTGGEFRVSWSRLVEGTGDRSQTTSLTFTQPLLKGFGPDVDTAPLRKARKQERINLSAFRDSVASLVGSVIGAYRRVLRAQRRLAIAREALERAQRQLRINRLLVEAGRMAPQDLVQSEAALANRRFALNDSEYALETASAALGNVLDLEDGVRVLPSEEPAGEPERPDERQSLEIAFERRTDWLRARLGVEFAEADLRVAQNNLLPNLSIMGRITRGGRETDHSMGVNLTIPLWDDRPRRDLVRARNSLRRARMARAETRQSIRIEVRQAVRGVAVALRQIDLSREARGLAERKLEVERLKLQQGLSSPFQISRFEDDLVSAQGREVDAAAGYRDALGRLDRTLGTTLDRWGISVQQAGR